MSDEERWARQTDTQVLPNEVSTFFLGRDAKYEGTKKWTYIHNWKLS